MFVGHEIVLNWNDIKKVNLESVRRVRQKIQEGGLYLPTDPEVLKRRKKLQKVFADYSHTDLGKLWEDLGND